MKHFLLFLAGCISIFATAQQPERIYGKNRILHTNDYYLEQMELWKKETEKNPKNAEAWYNYYRSSRNAYIVGEETDSLNTKGINRFARLNAIVAQMEKHVPKSYEYNYVMWLNGNNNPRMLPYLHKAHELRPQESEAILSLGYYYEIIGDTTQSHSYFPKFYKTGDYSPGMHNFTYNVLAGLDTNAIILTEGDKDTDAIFILQNARGIRTDVRMLNLNLLLLTDYRKRMFDELGIAQLDYDPLESEINFEYYKNFIIQHLAANTQNRPVYTSITVSRDYYQTISDQMYVTGLTRLYTTETPDQIALLKENFDHRYLMDYVHTRFAHDISEGWVTNFNVFYLEGLSILYYYYLESGDEETAINYYRLGYKIAEQGNNLHEFDLHFESNH